MRKEPILQMQTDKMIPRHTFNKTFMVRFPNRGEGENKLQPDRKEGLIWYTDGSKTNEGTAARM
jgi:hypothetical protein